MAFILTHGKLTRGRGGLLIFNLDGDNHLQQLPQHVLRFYQTMDLTGHHGNRCITLSTMSSAASVTAR